MKRRMDIKLKVFIVLLILFAILNITWFVMCEITYNPLAQKLVLDDGYYLFQDEEGYNYNVKKPDYLTLTGNLSISAPNFTGLIVWPDFFSNNYEIGIRIEKELIAYEIHIDKNGNVVNLNNLSDQEIESQQEIISKNIKEVNILLKKANEMWNLFYEEMS